MIRNVRLKITLVEHTNWPDGRSRFSARFGSRVPTESINVYESKADAINSALNTISVWCPVFRSNFINQHNSKPLLAITNATQITNQK